MQRHLEAVAGGNSLVQTQKLVPLLVRVANDPKTLPRESPMEGVGEGGAEDRNVAKGKPFAVIHGTLLRRIAGQERGSMVAEVLPTDTPKIFRFSCRGLFGSPIRNCDCFTR